MLERMDIPHALYRRLPASTRTRVGSPLVRLRPLGIAPMPGGDAGNSLECFGEMVRITELQLGGNLTDGKTGAVQQLLGPVDPQLHVVLVRRHARLLREDVAEALVA